MPSRFPFVPLAAFSLALALSAASPPKSILFENMPDSVYAWTDPAPAEDTLTLPDKTVKGDSLGREFRKYWETYEKREGFDQLKGQAEANDINKSKIPHWYLFDSTVVIYPFFPLPLIYLQW